MKSQNRSILKKRKLFAFVKGGIFALLNLQVRCVEIRGIEPFLYPSILVTGEESVSLSSSFILRKNWYVGEETFIISVREISYSERNGHSLTQNKIDEH